MRDALPRGTDPALPDNSHPDQIIICSATGVWIEWDNPEVPEPGSCPHGSCRCTPTLYDQRRTNLEVAALREALYIALLAPPYDDDSENMEQRIAEARAKLAHDGAGDG